MNLALLVLRLTVGLLVAAHGIQKVSNHLGGHGLEAEAVDLAAHGLRGGKAAAALSGLTQIGAGLSISAGFLTPLGTAGVIGVMLVAASTKVAHGLWVQRDGMEYPLLLAVLAAVVAIAGPGHWSLDRLAGFPDNRVSALVAIGVGVVAAAAAVPALRQRSHQASDQL